MHSLRRYTAHQTRTYYFQASNSRDSTSSSAIQDSAVPGDESKKSSKCELPQFTDVLSGVGLAPRQVASELGGGEKTEFEDSLKQDAARNTGSATIKTEKKSDKNNDASRLHGSFAGLSSPSAAEHPAAPMPSSTKKGRTASRKGSTRSATPTSVCGNDTESTLSNISDHGFTSSAPEAPFHDLNSSKVSSIPKSDASAMLEAGPANHSVIVSGANSHQTESTSIEVQARLTEQDQRLVSPLKINATGASGSGQSGFGYSAEMFSNAARGHDEHVHDHAPAKKARRGRTPKAPPVAPDSPPSSPESSGLLGGNSEQPTKRRKKAAKGDLMALAAAAGAPPTDNDHKHQTLHLEGFLPSHSNHRATSPSQMGSSMKRDGSASFHHANHSAEIHHHQEHPLPKAASALPTSTPTASAGMKDHFVHLRTPDSQSTSTGKEHPYPQAPPHQLYQRNGVNAPAPHMLGNQLNPSSSVALKMTEFLTAEQEAHSVGVQPSPSGSSNMTGVPFPLRNMSPMMKAISVAGSDVGTASFPQSLEQLLERQWEQGSQFLMEQAQHFDSKNCANAISTF